MLEKHTKELARLATEKKAIEAQEVEIKQKLINEMKALKLSSYKADYGSFTLGERRSYTYSPEVKSLEDSLKMKKVEEEERGIAEVKVSEYITVRV